MRDLQVFISGSARSGTSITYLCMRKVFDLPGRGESHVMPIFCRMLAEFEKYMGQKSANPNLLVNSIKVEDVKGGFGKFLQSFYAEQYPARSWVDKTPGPEAILAAGFVKFVFPDAKFIFTKRTGVEVVQSFRKKFNAKLESACRNWVASMEAVLSTQARIEDVIVIDQFDMTNNAGDVAKSICCYLDRNEQAESLTKFFIDTRIEQKSKHNWKNRLRLDDLDWTEEEKLIFVEICGDMMRKFGYPM